MTNVIVNNTTTDAENDKELSNAGFGLRLKKLRKEAKISRSQMAEALGMETNSLGLIERGINGISRKNLLLLYQKYDFDLNYLLTGKYSDTQVVQSDEQRNKWISIYDKCPREKIDSLVMIASCMVDNF